MFRLNYGSSTDFLISYTVCDGVISAERFGWTMEGSWYDVKQLSNIFLEALTKFKKNLCKRSHIWGQELNIWPYRFEVEMFKFHLGFWYFSTKIFLSYFQQVHGNLFCTWKPLELWPIFMPKQQVTLRIPRKCT